MAEHEAQFSQLTFNYMLGDGVSNVNINFNDLINNEFYGLPQYNQGFKSPIDYGHYEHGEKGNFGARKRRGFREITWFNDNTVNDQNMSGRHVSDMKILENYIYVMMVDDNGQYFRIFRRSYTSNSTNYDVYAEDKVSSLNDGLAHSSTNRPELYMNPNGFDRGRGNKKVSKKFCITSGGIGEPKISDTYGTSHLNRGKCLYLKEGGILRAALSIGSASQAKIANREDFRDDYNLSVGDRVVITDSGSDGSAIAGQSAQLGPYNYDEHRVEMGSITWLGQRIRDNLDSGSAYLNDGWNTNIYVNNYGGNDVKFYEDFGPVMSYVNMYGIQQINYRSTTTPDITLLEQTRTNNSNSITNVFNYMENTIMYTNDKGYLNILRPSAKEQHDLSGTIYQTMFIGINPLDIVKAQDYIVLSTANDLYILYENEKTELGDTLFQKKTLMNGLGAYGQGSLYSFQNNLYMYTNEAEFVAIIIKPFDNGLGNVTFDVDLNVMSKHRVNQDLVYLRDESIYGKHKPVVKIKVDQRNTYIIMYDRFKDTTDTEIQGTKILVYDTQFKFRHKRYIPGQQIRDYYPEISLWSGSEVLALEGNTDLWRYKTKRQSGQDVEDTNYTKTGQNIKQIISSNFGDTSPFTWKHLGKIKIGFGYNSKISDDTTLSITRDGGGIQKNLKINNINKTSKYIKDLIASRAAQQLSVPDNEYKDEDYSQSNSIGDDPYPTLNWKNDLSMFDNYGSGFTYNTVEAGFSKFGITTINTDVDGQNFYIELTADKDDAIEFIGYMLIREFIDNTIEAIDNTLRLPTPGKDY